jgi:alcohol dehydrogenase class IV
MPFEISHLTPVVFGEGVYQQTGKKLKEFGAGKVLCVYDPGIKAAGIADKIIQNIKAEGIQVFEYDGVLPDPPDTIVDAAAEIGREENVDAIIGLGGGSSLDAAKAVNILMGNPGSITEYFDPAVQQKPGKLLILIPTTSGTGSEVTKVAVLSNTTTGLKQGIVSKNTIAALAIVDPSLTLGLPPGLTASTGMDTFAHAVESYTSVMENDMSDILSVDAMKLVVKYLPIAVANGKDLEARTKMSFACLCAGYAFGDNMIHYGHALAHTIGAKYHIAHGTLCALMLPLVMEYVADVKPDRVRTMGKILGVELPANVSNEAIGSAVADAVRQFNKKIGILLSRNKVRKAD